jgi:cytochrome c-type biogenesis protein CcmE
MKRSWLIGGAVVIIGAFAWLILGGLRDNVVYFLTPGELLAKGAEGVDVPVRLGGQVKPGSREWDAATLDLRFTVMEGADTIRVKSSGAPPQMFREGMGVIVEGRYGRDGVFHATSLLVKHSNEYRANDGTAPHDKARTLIKPSP